MKLIGAHGSRSSFENGRMLAAMNVAMNRLMQEHDLTPLESAETMMKLFIMQVADTCDRGRAQIALDGMIPAMRAHMDMYLASKNRDFGKET